MILTYSNSTQRPEICPIADMVVAWNDIVHDYRYPECALNHVLSYFTQTKLETERKTGNSILARVTADT